MQDLRDETVVVTGGAGFVGRHVVAELERRGYRKVRVVRSRDYDLVRESEVARMYADLNPAAVLHLAAVVGGIGANMANPGRFFYANLKMGVELIEQARLTGVRKLVAVGTICAYPKHTPVPFKEDDLWSGYPEETNAPYGLAKKMMLVQAQAYRQQYGFNAIYLLPVNVYGPYDNFDLETSHVIPALIRKCVDAEEKGEDLVVWGTGTPTREFVYVEDLARALVLALERYDGAEPVNIGSGHEIAIRELVALIARETGFRGRVRFDPSKRDGQPRRSLDTSRAKALFGFEAEIDFAEGLKRTVAYWRGVRAAQK